MTFATIFTQRCAYQPPDESLQSQSVYVGLCVLSVLTVIETKMLKSAILNLICT